MKWNFLYQITAASRTPDYGATASQIPVLSVLCPQLNLLNPPPNKIPGYATGCIHVLPMSQWSVKSCRINDVWEKVKYIDCLTKKTITFANTVWLLTCANISACLSLSVVIYFLNLDLLTFPSCYKINKMLPCKEMPCTKGNCIT